MSPTVDVIIVTRDRSHLIGKAVESVLTAATPQTMVTIVDQSSDSATAEVVGHFCAQDERVVYLPIESKGSSLARNAGIAETSGQFVLFTDDDCVVAGDWVTSMIAEFDMSSSSAVFGALRGGDTDRPEGAAAAPWLGVAVTSATERIEFAPNTTDLGFGHGANMGFRRTALDEVNNFDPMLGVGCALRSWPERDIGFRLLRSGHRISFTPSSVVQHNQWRSWDDVYAAHRNYAFGAGAAAAKYVRCREWKGLRVLRDWLVHLGVRQIVSGVIRWRDPRKVRIGLIDLFYPALGAWRSRSVPIDREHCQYLDRRTSEAE